MAIKQTGKKTYKTMQGKTIDMDLLRKRNELTPAVGNAKVNARGDELGPGGKIIKKREEVLADYYRDNPTKVPEKVDAPQQVQADEPAKEEVVEPAKEDVEWVEDADGNFVKKEQ
tara:strand:+ start:6443 stop:6787 length:345 start_codon:yes stop_codon:yes gene_type:complete